MRAIELDINYFKDQIKIYKDKRMESLRKAQEFAIEEDLGIRQIDSGIAVYIPSPVNVEANRVKAANEIRLIDQMLIQIENPKDALEESIYIASTIPELKELPEELRALEI